MENVAIVRNNNDLKQQIVEEAIDNGPSWNFCPHFNIECRADCLYIRRPYYKLDGYGGYDYCPVWECVYLMKKNSYSLEINAAVNMET